MNVELILAVFLAAAVFIRLVLSAAVFFEKGAGNGGCIKAQYAIRQTTGGQEIQSDCVQVDTTTAGTMAVMADGIGKKNVGRLCAQVAVDTILDRYEPYHVLNNPEYFFGTVFREANLRIQNCIGEHRGGACLAAVLLGKGTLHYALAGNIRIALFRNKELIPISRGHTMDVLAAGAYEAGKITKKETIWSMEEKQVWNYLGMDGFHEIEFADPPIHLRAGDQILAVSKGIWQELSWAEIEDILLEDMSLQEKADRIVEEADRKPGHEKENGSILLLNTEVSDEKDKF